MNVIVIGLGSMGRRRARLLQAYNNELNIIGIDTNPERREQAENELGILTGRDIETVCQEKMISAAFVSTAPLAHAEVISQCLEHNLHVFSEINLSDDRYEENIELARNKGKVLFLSSTFLYRKEVQYIKNRIKESGNPVNYIYHVGQYLPDWHPWENYKNFFAGDKRTSGCRELMAIELPWIIDNFGEITCIQAINRKISSLDIDYPDTYQVILQHENGNSGIVMLDVVSRKAERLLKVCGESIFLTWGGTPESLWEYDFEQKSDQKINLYDTFERKEGYSDFIIEDAYMNEVVDFFNVINKKTIARYSFQRDKKILQIIDTIEGR